MANAPYFILLFALRLSAQYRFILSEIVFRAAADMRRVGLVARSIVWRN